VPFTHSVNSGHGRPSAAGADEVDAAEVSPQGPSRIAEPLSFGALRAVAAGVARSQVALPLDDHDLATARSLRLLATDFYDVWLVTWPPTSGRSFHGHGPVRSVLHVIEGELVEIFSDDGDARASGSRLLRRGESFCATPSFVHDLANHSGADTTTLHVYSPPLTALTTVDHPPVDECHRLRSVAARHRFRQASTDKEPALRLPPRALVRRPRRAPVPVLTAGESHASASASSANISQASSASSSSVWVPARSVPSRFIST